ncbi:MAG: hypothetical protein ACKVXR_07405 [Planctomycetota bacterium]
MLVVLLVLIALLVLSAPFLLMARNADRASAELSDRTEARLALDAAARHARLLLGESHAGFDRTPYFDEEEEIEVDNRFDREFYDANDPGGLMWDVECEDVAGKIDLNSAPPQLVANLMGATSRFVRAVQAEDTELPTASMAGFDPTGVVWVNGELIRYSKLDGGTILEPVRGLLGPVAGPDGVEWRGGPRPPSGHDAGAPLLDQRAFAPALWRAAGPDGELRAFDSPGRLREAGVHALVAALGAPEKPLGAEPEADARPPSPAGLTDEALRPLLLHGSVHGGVRGGQLWQRPMRLTSQVKGGEDGILRCDTPRWLNPGSTIQITDGFNKEVALVQEVRRGGEVVLDRILVNDYEPWTTIVRVLARRPVNLNSASPRVLVALFTNLQVAGRNSRITRDEAQKLGELVVESRPFTGLEDFLRRVVLPAAGLEKLPGDAPVVPSILAGQSGQAGGGGFIDPDDALALYMNGLNANDAGLQYSTMPFGFTTRDVYDLELRATVGAPSGVERFSLVREQTDLVVPQRELMTLWARQEDFDEACRLDLEAPWFMTGPSSTSRYDSGAVPPSRLWAHMGTANGQIYLPGVTNTGASSSGPPPVAEHVFASREETGWVQLWPARVAEASQRTQGRVMHFDHETRDPEGRYLPDEIVTRPTDDTMVAWTVANEPLCRPLSFSLWVKPRAVADSMIFDLGGTSHDLDRVSLQLEGADLVLRVRSGGGDHPDTVEKEWGEARYSVASGTGAPGLPVETWSHVDFDVRGDRPDQITMLVNGLAHGVRTPGMTRLTAGIGQDAGTIPVESVEGFPAQCTVRIGNELMEVLVANGGMQALRQETGLAAGFGGRIAREPFATLSHHSPATAPTADVPANLASITTSHPAGTTVSLYGYSLPVLSDVPVGRKQLPADLGPFRAARLAGVEGGATPQGDPIIWTVPWSPLGFTFGHGLEGAASGVTGLVLASADSDLAQPNSVPASDFMPAFNPNGGYAAIMQVAWTVGGENETAAGTQVGGIEIVQYSGWSGTTLQITKRGDQLPELDNLETLEGDQADYFSGRRAFVANWNPNIHLVGQTVENRFSLAWQTYVIPISVPVPGASALDYLAARKGASQFAQLTRIQDAELTEWVRYDWLETASGQLVRDDPAALIRALFGATGGLTVPRMDDPQQPPGPSGPSGGMALSIAAPPSAPSPTPPSQSQTGMSTWDPRIGQGENDDYPVSEAIETAFQFRGVFGTFSHEHKSGTLVLPVFKAALGGADEGRPGRLDSAFLFDANPTSLGWPVRVHRAHAPGPKYGLTGWTQNDYPGPPVRVAIAPPGDQGDQDLYLVGINFIALQAAVVQPLTADPAPANQDARLRTRLVCFPSGEKPRIVGTTTIGRGFDGAAAGAVPSAVVDEAVYGDAQFGRASPGDPDAVAGASLVLQDPLDDAGLQTRVRPKSVRLALGHFSADYEFLTETPDDAGLLRIGDEIVCYNSRQTLGGEISIAPGGRGLLGTTAQPHEVTEPVTFLEHRAVSFLAGNIGASDSALPIANTADFPNEGTVLVGSELIHYTRIRQNALEMPRASSEPGKMDEKGPGLFRGRFGTTAASHAMGEPVILFPFRYWDRWEEQADAPELAYFKLSIDQPAAFWDSFFFAKEDATASRIGVLMRSDPVVPWDADPEKEKRIALLWDGDVEGRAIPIGHQSDQIEWRVFVEYAPGAFDLVTGAPHGWKETPRLSRLGAFYFGPGMVLSAVER